MTRLFILILVLVFVIPGASTANTQKPESTLSEHISNARHALIQGDDTPAKTLLASGSFDHHPELIKLEILVLIEEQHTERAETKLNAFEQRYAEHPATFAFSAESWRELGHQASIFSKRGYYRKAVKAKLKTGVLAPDDPRYMTLRASALGQGSQYGGNPSQQSEITRRIAGLDKKWGYIAKINLAQNDGNEELGKALSIEAAREFSNDFDVLERVAQFFWTIGDNPLAQVYFARTCEKRPEKAWYPRIKWINACYQVAIFARGTQRSKDLGVDALTILLEEYTLPTKENFKLARLLTSIANTPQSAPAIRLFQRILATSDDSELQQQARAALKQPSS